MVFGVDGTEKKNDKYDFNRAFQTFIQKSNKPQFIVTSISGYTLPQTIPTNKECSNMCVDAHNHVNHPQSDLGEKQFQCSMCPKRYKYKDSLNKHYITHGKKPYNCVICSESFTRRSNFIEHNMIIHTGEKKFVCKVCSKSFYVLGRLRQHEKVHSDEEKRYETVHLKDSQFQQTEFHTQEQSFSNDLSTSSCTVTQIESSDGDNRNIIEENIKAGLNTQEKNVEDDLNSQEDLKNEFNIYEQNIKIEFTSHDVEDENITSDVKPPLELIPGDSQQITENETVTWETDQEITNTGNTYDKTNGVQDLQTEQDVDITLDIKPFKLIPGLNSQQITEIDKTISEDKNKKVHTEEMLFSEISEEIPFNSKMYSDTFNTEKKLKKCENNIQPQENQFFNDLSTNCFEAVLNKTSDEDESNLVDVKNDSNVEDNIDIHEENIKVDFTNRDARDIELQQVAEVDIATLSKEIEAVVTSTNISNDTNYLNKECSENLVADNNCVQPRKTNEKEKRIHSQTKRFHCKNCSKSFHTNNQLVRHERVHTGERPFVCKICSHSFKELSHLKTHQRIHSGEKPFVCKICSHSFKQVSHLKSHQQIHSGEKPFVCKICSHSCRRLSDLKTHQWVHSIEKPFVCEICSHSFKRPSHLKTHQQVHSGEKPFVCKFCSKSFVRKLYLRDHERIHTEKPYSCQYCSKIFRLSKYFKVHLKTHLEKEKKYCCEICTKSFYSKKGLKNHQKTIHEGEKLFSIDLSTNQYKSITIENSDEKYFNIDEVVIEDDLNIHEKDVEDDLNVQKVIKDHLKIHEENIKVEVVSKDAGDEDVTLDVKSSDHLADIELQQVAEVDIATVSKEIEAVVTSTNISNDTNYLNKECSENLVADNNCVQPGKTDEREKQFHCRICSKNYKSKALLQKHGKIHSQTKQFHCKICFKSFRTNNQLVGHERVHTGERPFVCKICPHSFKQLSHLKTHQQVHSGEKPFVCKICSKAFADKFYLRDHERIHTEKPFSCQYCSKIFRLSKSFKVHLKTHLEKEKNIYCCEICTKSFYSKKGLKKHQKRIHEGEKLFSIDLSTNQYKSISIENSDEKYFNIDEVVIKDDLNIHEKDVEDDSNVQKVIKDHLKIHEENIKVEVVSKDAGDEDVTLDVKSSDHLAGIELQQVAEVDIATVSKEIEAVVTSTNISNDTNYLNKECSENSVADNNCVQPGKTDEREKQFHCRICSKNYKSKALLQKHGKIHSQTKQFHCKICFKSFRNNNQLVGHERVHTGERPFVCKICPHSFKQLSHLKTHQQVHSGEKPFVCKICSKAFADKFYLRDHERIHTEKRFSCQYCPKTFHLSKSFKKHLKIHLEKKLYFCEICTKLFFSMNGFKKHQKTIHKDEKLFSMDPSTNQCKPILVENLDEKYFNIYEEVIEDDLNIHEKDVKDDSNVQEVIKDDLKIHEENEYKSKDVGDEKVTLDVKSNYSRESNLKLVTEDIEIKPAFFK